MSSVGQFCDNGCNQISWLCVFHSLLKSATNYHEDAQRIHLRRFWLSESVSYSSKKKGVSLKQKWVSFKTKNNSTRDFACPRSRLAQARLSNFVFLFLFEPGFFALSFTLHFAPIQTLLCTIFLQEKGRKAQCYFENTLCLNWKPYSLFISCYKRKFC